MKKRKILFLVLLSVLLLIIVITLCVLLLGNYRYGTKKETLSDTNLVETTNNKLLENVISVDNEVMENTVIQENIVLNEPTVSTYAEPKVEEKTSQETTPKETVKPKNTNIQKTEEKPVEKNKRVYYSSKKQTQTKQIEVPLKDERHYFLDGQWYQESDWFEADFDF